MALEESLSNAIRHGNKLRPESKVVRTSPCKVSGEPFLDARSKTRARASSPTKVADCTSDEGLEATGGRGMMLIEAYMTTVEHNDRGNCLTLEKIRGEADDGLAGD